MRKTDPSHKIEPTKFDFWLRRGQPKAPAYFVAPYSGARNAGRARFRAGTTTLQIKGRRERPPSSSTTTGVQTDLIAAIRAATRFWSFPGPNNLSTFAGSQISGAIRKAKSAS